jgi:phosphopantothenoylcysteine decarboxylase/phosphopantothenate--cysteine ligase
MSDDRRVILLAIGGGIAAYKSAFLCSRLAQLGHEVRVAMTESATQFIGVQTLAALSGRSVATDSFTPDHHPLGSHIEVAEAIDLMIVAPATANLLSKFAGGLADDLVSTLYLQRQSPVLLAPAMSNAMWSKPAVERNVAQLREDGCHLIGPAEGWLSCRVKGEGRMSEPDEILSAARSLLGIA